MKKIVILSVLAMTGLIAGAVEIQSTGNGNWTNTATWNTGAVPTLADQVLIKYDDTVTVDSSGNEVGWFRLDAGKSYLNLNAGGELTVVNSGDYPTNGVVTFRQAATPCNIIVQGGDLEVQGDFKIDGGNSGVTNTLDVSSGSIGLKYFEIGLNSGGGKALVNIEGADTAFSVSGNMVIGTAAVFSWTPAANGTVTPIASDNFRSVTLHGGELIVDMSEMTGRPQEIVLLDNNGTDAIDGMFAATNLIGTTDYSLSYTGGDGNDIALVKTALVSPTSELIAEWTRAQTWPSRKNPDENALKVRVDQVDNSGSSDKFDRGSSDLTYGSGLFTNVADEAAFHSSTSCYTIAVQDALRVVMTNGYGSSGLEFQLDYVLADWTAPFAQSPKTLNIKYVEGDLGIPVGTVLGTDFMYSSSLIGFDDYADVDIDLTGFDMADRTLTNGQYAVFEITASTNIAGSTGVCYIDNIALAATIITNQTLSGYDAWVADYPSLTGGPQDDDDGDGLSNLEEFGLGGSPVDAGSIGYEPAFGPVDEYLEFIHVRRTTAGNGLTYILEQNSDLVNGVWTNSGDYVITGTNSMPSDPDFEAITNRISTAGKSQEFLRLIIE